MKHIDLVYEVFDKEDAESIYQLLVSAGEYEVQKVLLEDEIVSYLTSVNEEKTQLILSLNMAGFRAVGSDENLLINSLPMNIVTVLTHKPEIYASYLERRMNYTISFLLLKNDVSDIREKYGHIYCVETIDAYPDIIDYLKQLDWRFEGTR